METCSPRGRCSPTLLKGTPARRVFPSFRQVGNSPLPPSTALQSKGPSSRILYFSGWSTLPHATNSNSFLSDIRSEATTSRDTACYDSLQRFTSCHSIGGYLPPSRSAYPSIYSYIYSKNIPQIQQMPILCGLF